jgi:hypothetical protein
MPLVTTLLLRTLVLILAVVSAVGQIAYLDVLYWHRLGWALAMSGNVQASTIAVVGGDAVVAVIAAVLAVALVFSREAARGSRPLAVAVVAWSYLLSYGGVFRLLMREPDSPFRAAFEAHFLVVECLGLAGLLAFSASFPSSLSGDDLLARNDSPPGLRPFVVMRAWLLRPAVPWIAALALAALILALARALGNPILEAPLSPVMDVARFGTLALVVVNFRSSWDLRSSEQRALLNWMVLGMVLVIASLALLIGGSVLTAVTQWRSPVNWRPILLNFGLLGLLWGSSMATFYRGRLNARILMRQTATWTGLATALLFLAAGLEALFSDNMMARVSLPTGIGTLAAICVFAWIYHPTRRLVEIIIEQISAAGLPEDA